MFVQKTATSLLVMCTMPGLMLQQLKEIPIGVLFFNLFSIAYSDSAIQKRNTIHAAFQNFSSTNSQPYIVSYPLDVIEFSSSGREMRREQWIVQQGVGDMIYKSINL